MQMQNNTPAVKKKRSSFRKPWELYILLLPAMTYTFIFHYLPMYGVQIAFKNYQTGKGIWGSSWVGLQHFRRFLSYPAFWEMIRNTLSITLYSLATFPLAIIFALLINELTNLGFKKTVQMVSYAPHFLSTVVVCGMLLLFLDRGSGLFNTVRALFGKEAIPFISIPSLFSTIYVWSGVWQGIGWGTILYISALSGVSPELIEAAKIDGATKLQIIRHINIPWILPTVVIVFIMSTGGLLSVGFEKIFLLQNPLNLEASRVLATYTYEVGIQGGQFSYSSAIGFFNMITNAIIVTLVNFIAKKVSGTGLF